MYHFGFSCREVPVKLLLLVLLTSSLAGSAAEPPPNTIPVITMKTGQDSTCFEVDHVGDCGEPSGVEDG